MTGRRLWSIDAEWGFRNGRVDWESAFEPVLFCALEVNTQERVHFWGRDGRLRDFIRANRAALFVSHNMVAEAKYLLRLGAPLPENWFDTMLAWRYLSNSERVPLHGLSAALEASGLSDLVTVQKKELQQQVLHLRFDGSAQGRQAVLDYCFRDCQGA